MLTISSGRGQGQGASVRLYGIKRSIIVRFHSPLNVIYSWVKVGKYVNISSLQKYSQIRLISLKVKEMCWQVTALNVSELKGISTNMNALSIQDG